MGSRMIKTKHLLTFVSSGLFSFSLRRKKTRRRDARRRDCKNLTPNPVMMLYFSLDLRIPSGVHTHDGAASTSEGAQGLERKTNQKRESRARAVSLSLGVLIALSPAYTTRGKRNKIL